MIPFLARRGKLVLASGAWFMVLGALYSAPPLIALGGVVISAVMSAFLWFFPTAIFLRRRKVKLLWWLSSRGQIGRMLFVDHPINLHFALRNHSDRLLRVSSVQIFASSALELPDSWQIEVPAGWQVERSCEVRPVQTGYQVLHGASLFFADFFGLFRVHAYFASPMAIRVFPEQLSARLQSTTQVLPRGKKTRRGRGPCARQRGLTGRLREIREHCHGDSFKYIAWKATARRQRLMVKEFENEIVMSQQFLVDMGSTMRRGAPGQTKLDYSIRAVAALAKEVVASDHRVGLVTYDTRVYGALKPGAGPHHFLRVVNCLLDTQNVVDSDLTRISHAEITAFVAQYLVYQEAVDARLRRALPLDDPGWERVQPGPEGELYDTGILDEVVTRALKLAEERKEPILMPSWWWQRAALAEDSRWTRLRLFCRLRGIELPYQHEPDSRQRVFGLGQAIRQAIHHRQCDTLVIFSDLVGIAGQPAAAARHLARARQRGRQVLVVAPCELALDEQGLSREGREVAALCLKGEEVRLAQVRRMLANCGVPLLKAGLQDSAAALAGRIARVQRSGRAA